MIKRKKINHNINELLLHLTDRFKKEKDIIFAYIFGSYGKGKITPLSDVDIAVYLDTKGKIWERKLELLSIIIDILQTDEINFIILNETTPSLVCSILDTGKLLFSKDEIKRISFFVKNLKEYLDLEYHLSKIWKAMKNRIKGGQFGF